MRVVTSSIQMQTRHQASQTESRQTSLQIRAAPSENSARATVTDMLTLSDHALSAAASAPTSASTDPDDGLSSKDRLNIALIRRLFKLVTGHDLVVATPGQLRQALQGGSTATSASPSPPARANSSNTGLTLSTTVTRRETEATSFSASGTVKTADGQTLQFSAKLNMSREFTSRLQIGAAANAPVKVDPLVINYGGKAAELGDARFEFDLDSDGDSEQIANLKPGSALLALDQNGNGSIDNGKELFGPTSGSGFAELAQYDQDHNGFIDEGDAVYDRLRLWIRDDAGGSKLVGLGQMGVGAIYLGSAATPFQLNDGQNRNLGQVSATGLFLREDGGTGTVQQVDYTV
ncbi:hypothetical protein SAMN02949497_4431 [Methylomagnum ishizawai]|uniref:VCBS repeat-containing protein n=1 Tax=Methylomagnum ishizawai TaxID=1760988 RepID=A0A1Y6DBL5_9GAMM|nr:hypothetical protein [Methylomagnum ishizawai]SMF97015.1 hypothetical protein SAMN02949497_4431 [Methylomagnum ishizawai]